MVFTSGYTEKLEKWLVTLTAVAAAILFLIVGKIIWLPGIPLIRMKAVT
ncbi:MAG: hypothetical protein LIP04_01755 [Tannerellaceae bacterium]|nr:hypothetical protein [Tannerellaceae bacterium]